MTVREWIRGVGNGLLFLPYVYKYAARLDQVEIRQMLSDPGILTRCVRDTQRLFGYDGVVCSFDTTLEAEACGCVVDWKEDGPEIATHVVCAKGLGGLRSDFENQARLPVVMEAAKRLRYEVSGRTSLLAGITGPLTLAAQLAGQSFGEELVENSSLAQDLVEFSTDVCITVCRRYCDLGVDGILVIEDFLALNAGLTTIVSELQSLLRTLRNVAQYYEVPLVLTVKGSYDLADLQSLVSLPIDALSIGKVESSLDALSGDADLVRKLGLSIPSNVFTAEEEGVDIIEEYARLAGSLGGFLTSEWEVPLNTVPQQLHQIVKVVSEHRVG